MAQVILNNGTAPTPPAAGNVTLYSKTSDHRLYYKDENNNETGPLTSSSGSGGTGGTNDVGFFENDVFLGSSYTIGQGAYIAISSITSTNPGIISTPATHTYVAGQVIIFATTGALPTNITAGVNYYVLAAGLTTTQFEISATAGGTAIDCTAGTQSGVHTVAKLKNAMSAGPIAIATGATITVPTGSTWSIL